MLTFKRSLGALSVTSALSLALGGCRWRAGKRQFHAATRPLANSNANSTPELFGRGHFPESGRSDLCVGTLTRHPGGVQGLSRSTRYPAAMAMSPTFATPVGGYYEIESPGETWDRLIPHSGNFPPVHDRIPASVVGLSPNFDHLGRKASGYQYSELAAWVGSSSNRYGAVAFGAQLFPDTCRSRGSRLQRNLSTAHPTSSTPTRSMVHIAFPSPAPSISASTLQKGLSAGRSASTSTITARRRSARSPSRTRSFRSEARPIPASSPLRRRGRIISWGNSPVRMRKRRLARGRCPSFLPPEAAP